MFVINSVTSSLEDKMSRRKTKTIPVYLKDKLLAEVEAIAEELGISQSEVLRHAFIEYLRNKNKLQTL